MFTAFTANKYFNSSPMGVNRVIRYRRFDNRNKFEGGTAAG